MVGRLWSLPVCQASEARPIMLCTVPAAMRAELRPISSAFMRRTLVEVPARDETSADYKSIGDGRGGRVLVEFHCDSSAISPGLKPGVGPSPSACLVDSAGFNTLRLDSFLNKRGLLTVLIDRERNCRRSL